MRRIFCIVLTGLMLMSPLAISGCDKKIAEEKEVDVDDNKIETRETTVEETPSGDIKIEKKSTTETPSGDVIKEETETETKPVENQ
jgi:hypothetical protein